MNDPIPATPENALAALEWLIEENLLEHGGADFYRSGS